MVRGSTAIVKVQFAHFHTWDCLFWISPHFAAYARASNLRESLVWSTLRSKALAAAQGEAFAYGHPASSFSHAYNTDIVSTTRRLRRYEKTKMREKPLLSSPMAVDRD